MTLDKQFTINVTDVNEVPTGLIDKNSSINRVKVSAAANSTVGITAKAIGDPDAGEVFSYDILSDDSGGLFTIGAADGVVRISDPSGLNVGQIYSITIVAYDHLGLSVDNTFAISAIS